MQSAEKYTKNLNKPGKGNHDFTSAAAEESRFPDRSPEGLSATLFRPRANKDSSREPLLSPESFGRPRSSSLPEGEAG